MPAKASEETTSAVNPLFLIVLVVAAFWFANRGSGPAPDVKPEPDKPVPGPVEPQKPTEKQVWDNLARFVELNRLPLLDAHTHQIVKIADELKAMGYLSDVSRVEPWRTAKREDITETNRASIVSAIRGAP